MSEGHDVELDEFFDHNDTRGVITAQWGKLDMDAVPRGCRAAGIEDVLARAIALARGETSSGPTF